jgi:hypothetical protein
MPDPVSFRFPDGLVERIDEARGDVPRTRWVVRALEAALGGASCQESSASPRAPERPSKPIEWTDARVDSLDVLTDPGPASEPKPLVPRRASFNVGPKPFAKPIPKGK